MMKEKVFKLEISIRNLPNEDIEVSVDTKGSKRSRCFEFEGYPDTAEEIKNWLLGEIAKENIEERLRELDKDIHKGV